MGLFTQKITIEKIAEQYDEPVSAILDNLYCATPHKRDERVGSFAFYSFDISLISFILP